MYKYLIGWFTALFVSYSCSDGSTDISIVCEENNVGNCVIVWETTPVMEGKVKIYRSTNPDDIPEINPIAVAEISDQRMVVVTDDPTQRYYYKLVFNNKYKRVTASRNVNIAGIQNFRDMGGIPATRKKSVRWGKIYRSAEFDELSLSAYRELRNIGVKTIIDFRDSLEFAPTSDELKARGFNLVHIPMGVINTKDIIEELRKGSIDNDSINSLLLRMNRELVTYYRGEYRQMFSVLLEEKNYPVVIHCTSGKGRTALASALILAALGVSDDQIMEDYRLSNRYFNIPGFSSYAYNLPSRSQEAITTLFSARESFLNAARKQIEKNYGDLSSYFKQGLNLTQEDINFLKEILLN